MIPLVTAFLAALKSHDESFAPCDLRMMPQTKPTQRDYQGLHVHNSLHGHRIIQSLGNQSSAKCCSKLVTQMPSVQHPPTPRICHAILPTRAMRHGQHLSAMQVSPLCNLVEEKIDPAEEILPLSYIESG